MIMLLIAGRKEKGGALCRKKRTAPKRAQLRVLGTCSPHSGRAISEILNDPELKEKAKEFGDAAGESAKALGKRLKDEEVKEKLSEAGKAAQDFGKTVAEHFQAEDRK